MSEKMFKGILAESAQWEYGKFDNAPEHKFSLKHRLAMKHIFARFEKNIRQLEKKSEVPMAIEYKSRLNLRQRIIIVTLIVILMSFLVGWVAVFVTEKFHGIVYHDNTQLEAVDIDNCPQVIEEQYVLAYVPDGYEIVEIIPTPTNVYTLYLNKINNKTITLYQSVKTDFSPHYDTEHFHLEEVDVNGRTMLCIDFGDETFSQSLVLWDNGDYIMEVVADLDKTEVLDLSNVTKLF